MAASADAAGFPYAVGEQPAESAVSAIWERYRTGPAEDVAGLIDRELFATLCTEAMLSTTRRFVEDWGPDLIVREPCEFSTAVVSRDAGIPQAQVAISLAEVENSVVRQVAPIIDGFCAGTSAAITSAPYLSSIPRAMDPSAWPDTRRYRPDLPARDVPPEPRMDNSQPLVYVTMGSVFGGLDGSPAAYRLLLEAISDLPVNAILTLGRAVDAADLGVIPANTQVVQWLDQAEILPKASMVVCHGGSGTTYGALAHGVPLVMWPSFADQTRNAHAVAAAGAGIAVINDCATETGIRSFGSDAAKALREAMLTLLEGPSYRDAAGRIGAEIARAPSLTEVIRDLS